MLPRQLQKPQLCRNPRNLCKACSSLQNDCKASQQQPACSSLQNHRKATHQHQARRRQQPRHHKAFCHRSMSSSLQNPRKATQQQQARHQQSGTLAKWGLNSGQPGTISDVPERPAEGHPSQAEVKAEPGTAAQSNLQLASPPPPPATA